MARKALLPSQNHRGILLQAVRLTAVVPQTQEMLILSDGSICNVILLAESQQTDIRPVGAPNSADH